ncbi:MAG: GAF domain-containing protein [Gemmatimonadaceae bacterium]|nr:GAF domain-containing protein [Gemmatimonadaceae bacterium]
MTTELVIELERRAARFAAVATVQQAISAAISLDETYHEIYTAVASVVDAPCFTLITADPVTETFYPQYAVVDFQERKSDDTASFPIGTRSISQAFQTGVPSITAEPERWWAGTGYEVKETLPVQSELTAPLDYRGRIFGVLQVLSYRAHAYDAHDMELITLIARQAAVAIENARLFAGQRSEQQQTAAAAEIARLALRKVTVKDGTRNILEVLDRVFPSRGKVIGVVTSDDRTLICVAANGSCSPMLDISAPVDESSVRTAWGRGKPTLLDDFRADAHHADKVPAEPAIVIPLIASDRRIGVLVVTTEAPRLQDVPYVDALLDLAPSVALAVDVLLLGEHEQRTHARERTLAAALATMDQPVLILGVDARVQYANRAAIREYGYEAREIAGLSVDDFVVASAQLSRRETIPASASEKGLWTGEHIHKRKDGTEFPAAVTLSHIRDGTENIVGLVIGVRNLTEERNIREHLTRAEKLAAVGELVAGVAHELNNPLTGISTFAQLLLEDKLETDQKESVNLIKREADRAIGVIRDLLLFARTSEPRDVAVDVNKFVQHTLRLRTFAARSAEIEVHLHLDGSNPQVRGDEPKLQQVLLNLLVNAEYALHESHVRHLSLVTRRQQDTVEIIIADTGRGMPEEIRQRIFEPFFTTKPAGEGTGLGLSVSYGIIQAHNGSISVESAEDAGTTFTITLPLLASAEA